MLSATTKSIMLLAILTMWLTPLVSCKNSVETPVPSSGDVPNASRIEIDLLSTKYEVQVDNNGKLRTGVQITSHDGTVTLSIDKGSLILDPEGKPPQLIRITINSKTTMPSEGSHMIGTAYIFEPAGTSIDPPLTLTLSYNQKALADAISENDIYIASCEGSAGWVNTQYKRINSENNRIATRVDRFAEFAIMAPLVATSPTPTPTQTVALSTKVDLLYFHPTSRCTTCKYFEERIRYVIATYFQKEVDSGKLELKLFDYLNKANADLVKKYKVVGSQLFINTTVNGVENIRGVGEIYQWGTNKEAFDKGLRAIIQKCLEGEK